MLTGHDILCVFPSPWDCHWGTQQQLISRLAETNRVVILEGPISPLSPFSGSHKGTWMRQIQRWSRGFRSEEKPSLTIVSPPPVLPFRYHKLTNNLTQRILARSLESAREKLNFKNPILITFQTDSGALLRRVNACVKIYYSVDDTSAFGGWWQPADKVRQREAELVKASDLVFATSRRLASRLQKLGTPTYFNPNAADFELFSQAQVAAPPNDVGILKRPVIGFVGMITPHSFDEDLMFWLAGRHPEWTFLMVGKKSVKDPDLRRLEQLPNCIFAGFQPLDMLPKYLARMNVCLLPRRQTEWVKSAFPVKFFEYLGAGKPVVATWTEELLPYQGHIYLPRDYPDFEQCIVKALAEDSSELISRRMALAKENTWDERVMRFSMIVQTFLDESRMPTHEWSAEVNDSRRFDREGIEAHD